MQTKKRIHLISNAHLDPVWLWRWEEGCGEALSTFRTAADLIDEYHKFCFNHNESILYQWVKENDAELFRKIQKLAAEGKWNLMGGWFLQPDCNMPSGESIVRNIMEGRLFFQENFNAKPTTAINFDSFGHSRGLVQILNQAGYDSYVVCRPVQGQFPFPDQDFIWKGTNDSSVYVHRSDENYNSVWGHAAEELREFIKKTEDEEVSLFLWGVGDHGGGPSRKDLKDLTELIEQEENYEIIHSTPEEYYKELKALNREFPVVEEGLNPVAPGCYTSQIRIKQKHRELENEIYSTEKMAAAAEIQYGKPYPKEAFHDAVRDLLCSEFHDALPGSGSHLVEEDTLRILDHGLELMSRAKMSSFIALTAGEPKVIDGTSVIMFYNPHPYDVTGIFECEFGLPKQNWTTDFMYPVVTCKGEPVKAQAEKEVSHFNLDWRKRVAVSTTLKASSLTRMDVSFRPIKARPTFPEIVSKPSYIFDNGKMKVVINTRTGLLDEYSVNGKNYLRKGSFRLSMFDDSYSPWGIGTPVSSCERTFQLLTPHEGSAFSGLGDKVIPSVRIIEDGDVRTVVEAVFGLHDSKAFVRYKLPKEGTSFDAEVFVHFCEKEQYLKLMLDTDTGSNTDFTGQIMFGREALAQTGEETVSHKWLAVSDQDSSTSLAVMNNGTYGAGFCDGTLGITLLRSSGYTASDFVMGKALHEDRFNERMEQGERRYHFRFAAGKSEEILSNVEAEALAFNEAPYAMAYCPSGKGEKKPPFLTASNREIMISALKKAERKDLYILRMYETAGKAQDTEINIPEWNINQKLSFKANEIRTFAVTPEGISETTLLEGTC